MISGNSASDIQKGSARAIGAMRLTGIMAGLLSCVPAAMLCGQRPFGQS
jgi:hypothetical protein